MPFFIGPYTLGTQLPADPTVVSGGGFSVRRRRYVSYMTAMIAFLLMWPL